jgi:hypothetical protein
MMTTKLNKPRWHTLILGFLMAAALGSRAARATSCITGELVDLVNPVVTVVDGPGNAATEQVHWTALGDAVLEGPLYIGLGERTFDLERLP